MSTKPTMVDWLSLLFVVGFIIWIWLWCFQKESPLSKPVSGEHYMSRLLHGAMLDEDYAVAIQEALSRQEFKRAIFIINNIPKDHPEYDWGQKTVPKIYKQVEDWLKGHSKIAYEKKYSDLYGPNFLKK